MAALWWIVSLAVTCLVASISAHPAHWPMGVEPVLIRYTPWNSLGGGNAVYLDRHTVYCPGNSVLKQFYLERCGDRIRYAYTCTPLVPGTCKARSFSTGFNSDGGGNTVYLDRHHVDCGWNSLVTRFHLIRDHSGRNVRYDVQCCDAGLTMICQNKETRFNSEGGGRLQYLDRHDVRCPAWQYIRSFRLSRGAGGNYQYRYQCCSFPPN